MPCVYLLTSSADPDTVRYVGISRHDVPDHRLQAHVKAASRGRQLPVSAWIRKHVALGHTINAVAYVSGVTWVEACHIERSLIAGYRAATTKLLNVSDGGDGGMNAEIAKKIVATRQKNKKPVSDETRKKLSDAGRGRKLTPETREKLRQAKLGKPGHPGTLESRKKISDALRGQPKSAETRKRMSEAKKGHPTSAEARRKIGEANRKKI